MPTSQKPKYNLLLIIALAVFVTIAGFCIYVIKQNTKPSQPLVGNVKSAETQSLKIPELNKAAYDAKLLLLANNPASSTASTTIQNPWPVKTVYPNAGALLPFNRVVAYYGNLYSKGMGVLGEYPEDEMLNKLSKEASKWQLADPSTPVIPALHYIAVVAQAGAGRDGKFRARMPDREIDKVLAMAQKIHPALCGNSLDGAEKTSDGNIQADESLNGAKCGTSTLVFLDIQIGLSSVKTEVPLLEKYLKLPNVHLGIDPEFAMSGNYHPGEKIGTLDAADVNFAAEFLAKVVRENNLPPKILVIHRFTNPMLTNYQNIKPLPEVQVVINMDGFGSQGSKLNTYKNYVAGQPVQFTGFKLFYKNDSAQGRQLLEPERLLKLSPIPSYIQYQ